MLKSQNKTLVDQLLAAVLTQSESAGYCTACGEKGRHEASCPVPAATALVGNRSAGFHLLRTNGLAVTGVYRQFTAAPVALKPYFIDAAVYDEESEYGLFGGCVSKLWIYEGLDRSGRCVASYDRGWDHCEACSGLIQAVVAELEHLAMPPVEVR